MARPNRPSRANAYYERLLRKKNPRIYARWQSGQFDTLKSALVAAKIRKEPSRYDLLVRHWSRATDGEKERFRKHIELDDLLKDLDMDKID